MMEQPLQKVDNSHGQKFGSQLTSEQQSFIPQKTQCSTVHHLSSQFLYMFIMFGMGRTHPDYSCNQVAFAIGNNITLQGRCAREVHTHKQLE